MRQRIRRAGLGFLVGAVIVLGGGFASAGYSNGDGSSLPATVNVTYTVQTFRALELSSTSEIAFGTVRQGETKTVDGPTLLYGTTWPTDSISVYLTSELDNLVELYVSAGTPTPPEDGSVTCAEDGLGAGVALTEVPIQDTSDDGSPVMEDLITGINNCGAPTYTDAPTNTAPNRLATSWATATTSFTLDTTNAEQVSGESNLYAGVDKAIYFLIDAAA